MKNGFVKCGKCNGTGIDGEFICHNCRGYGRILWLKNLIPDPRNIGDFHEYVFFEESKNLFLLINKNNELGDKICSAELEKLNEKYKFNKIYLRRDVDEYQLIIWCRPGDSYGFSMNESYLENLEKRKIPR